MGHDHRGCLHNGGVTGDSGVYVRPVVEADWPAIAAIYTAGIATGDATFDSAVPSWAEWEASHRHDLRFVAVIGESVVGWAAASSVSDRSCYAGVVEDSVYVASSHLGRGIGRLLLAHLVTAAEAVGVWTVQAGILPENVPSVRLHQACGFRVVGRRERLGSLNGVWRDVLLVEHRTAGIIAAS